MGVAVDADVLADVLDSTDGCGDAVYLVIHARKKRVNGARTRRRRVPWSSRTLREGFAERRRLGGFVRGCRFRRSGLRRSTSMFSISRFLRLRIWRGVASKERRALGRSAWRSSGACERSSGPFRRVRGGWSRRGRRGRRGSKCSSREGLRGGFPCFSSSKTTAFWRSDCLTKSERISLTISGIPSFLRV